MRVLYSFLCMIARLCTLKTGWDICFSIQCTFPPLSDILTQVGTDFLEESITAFEDYVQSVDIAAFNKI